MAYDDYVWNCPYCNNAVFEDPAGAAWCYGCDCGIPPDEVDSILKQRDEDKEFDDEEEEGEDTK